MKTPLLALCILLGSFLSVTFAYGDDIPTQGRWDDERVIAPLRRYLLHYL